MNPYPIKALLSMKTKLKQVYGPFRHKENLFVQGQLVKLWLKNWELGLIRLKPRQTVSVRYKAGFTFLGGVIYYFPPPPLNDDILSS